uniref:ABC-type glutathione-S-conjugate transporter n=1 Tax=Timema poppense TaxID=170557 RepID=A0A7R9GZH1_TIMPO|nr:unnamed protein product [Timema poppensis]
MTIVLVIYQLVHHRQVAVQHQEEINLAEQLMSLIDVHTAILVSRDTDGLVTWNLIPLERFVTVTYCHALPIPVELLLSMEQNRYSVNNSLSQLIVPVYDEQGPKFAEHCVCVWYQTIPLSTSCESEAKKKRPCDIHSLPCLREWDYAHCALESNLPHLVRMSGGTHVLAHALLTVEVGTEALKRLTARMARPGPRIPRARTRKPEPHHAANAITRRLLNSLPHRVQPIAGPPPRDKLLTWAFGPALCTTYNESSQTEAYQFAGPPRAPVVPYEVVNCVSVQDANLTWYTEDPDVTECFQKTALVWFPCLFLWLFTPLEYYYMHCSKSRDIPWNWYNGSKMVLTILLVLLSAGELGASIYLSLHGHETYHVDYITPAIKIVTLMLTLTLSVNNKRKGLQSSGLLFLFWFFLVLCGVPQFRQEIRTFIQTDGDMKQLFWFVKYLMYYIIIAAMFLLNFFADSQPKYSEYLPLENPCPELGASFPSRLFFSWLDPLVWKGYRNPLKSTDLWSLNPEDTSGEIVPVKQTGVKKEISVVFALCKAFGPTFLFGALLKIVNDLLLFVNPQLLKFIIQFVASDEPVWKGYLYAVLMLATASVQTLIQAQYFNRVFGTGLRALFLSNSARQQSTVGEIVNLLTVDTQRFLDPSYLIMFFSAPLQFVLALYFLWDILGPSVLAGIGVMIFLIPVNGFIANKAKSLQILQMKSKDKRVKLMNEILNGIKVLKLYAWEPSFEQRILQIRNKEMDVMKQSAYLSAGTSFVFSCSPFLVAFVSFATFVLVDENNILDAPTVFVSLTLFNIIRMPLSLMSNYVAAVVQANVSIQRINSFMNAEEVQPDIVSQDQSQEHPMSIENGLFCWNEDGPPILKNINLHVPQGALMAVIGVVGSGKSSLASAFLGEMYKLSGRVNVKGSVAYASQQAWIQNATLRDNILFGKKLDERFYACVLEACALKPDLDILPAGDQTEIGERGINLSGGQKQRVSLARTVYNGADIYLLDDPLSAVDSHVSKHIFHKVIGPTGILRNKTRVLMTHSITFLREVDLIVVLRDGEVSETGSYKELLARKGAFSQFLLQHIQDIATGDNDLKHIKEELESSTSAEETLKKLDRTISLLSNCSDSGPTPQEGDESLTENPGEGEAIKLVERNSPMVSVCVATLTISIGTLNAAVAMHAKMLSNVLRLPQAMFDTTPIGRILSRFSGDVNSIDITLPNVLRLWIPTVCRCFYIATSRQLKRLESISRSPIVSHFGESIIGASTIRAYGVSQDFLREAERRVDFNQACYYPSIIANRWLAVRLEIIGSIIIFFASLFAVLGRESMDPGLVGLSVSYALQITQTLQWLVRSSSDVETNIVAVERIKEYQEYKRGIALRVSHSFLKSFNRMKPRSEDWVEAAWELSDHLVSEDWPTHGVLEFRDYQLRYREDLDLVLNGINFTLQSGEKVGIVGRTGAGKSSLTLALFRIVEAAGGTILIDGVDISTLGLHMLRSRLTVIPQDPVLFSGSLRDNLDPTGRLSDQELLTALRHAGLSGFLRELPEGLSHEVTEGGENLSAGQRQLICLARALLRKTKIFILDEATAAVDLETDDWIQKTIRSEFETCTVLTIAHRLNTVLDSDRVIVLDKGCVIECDPPYKLLKDETSLFYVAASCSDLALIAAAATRAAPRPLPSSESISSN